jgi:hypothetical protein
LESGGRIGLRISASRGRGGRIDDFVLGWLLLLLLLAAGKRLQPSQSSIDRLLVRRAPRAQHRLQRAASEAEKINPSAVLMMC